MREPSSSSLGSYLAKTGGGTATAAGSPSSPLHVEILLSRPAYRLGGTVVGTVRVTLNSLAASALLGIDSDLVAPRDLLQSLELILIGRCRLDPRWHNVKEVLLKTKQNTKKKESTLYSSVPASDSNSVCFWITETIKLLELPERREGNWDAVKPKPIRLPGRNVQRQEQDDSYSDSTAGTPFFEHTEHTATSGYTNATEDDDGDSITSNATYTGLEEEQLSFSFRADLPWYMPHSMHGTSCRYYYDVAVRYELSASALKASPATSRVPKQQWTLVPFAVLTADPDIDYASQQQDESQPLRSSIPSSWLSSHATGPTLSPCFAMAHSSGLPCALTAVELNQSGGQLTVSNNMTASALYRHVKRHDARHLQTMRVADPLGRPVCILTLMGATPLQPGCRVTLKVDFPISEQQQQRNEELADNDESASTRWVPCYQVSTCLQGEETVLKGGDPSLVSPPPTQEAAAASSQSTRARLHIFDTAHQAVDPLCTERLSLNLQLPVDAPCTLKTNVVDVSIKCLVDICVGRSSHNSSSQQYQTLRLEIPCQVQHSLFCYERKELEDDDRQALSIHRLLGRQQERPADSFPMDDILDELRILSLVMAERCGLGPRITGGCR